MIALGVLFLIILTIALCTGKKQQNDETVSDIELQLENKNEFPKQQESSLEFETKIVDVEIIRRIGRGSFGEVFYGEWLKTVHVVLKHVHTQPGFAKELKVLSKLCHPNVVSVFGYFEDNFHKKYIAMEFVPKGSLKNYIQTPEGKTLSRKQMAYIAVNIANGMQYLHSQNILHRDLTARNVMMVDNPEHPVKITDFGMTSIIDQTFRTSYPVKWYPPEVVERQQFSKKSDVWSFGVTLWELFMFGIDPYANLSNAEISMNVLQNPLPKPNACPNGIYQLMLCCWELDPEQRPDFSVIVEQLTSLHSKIEDDQISQSSSITIIPKELGKHSQFKELGWCGQIDRPESEKMLKNTPVGTFLIRYSEKKQSYVLSTRTEQGYLHVADIYPTENEVVVKTNRGQQTWKSMVDYLSYMKKSKAITTSIHESVKEMPSAYMNYSKAQDKSDLVYLNKEESGVYGTENSNDNNNNNNIDIPTENSYALHEDQPARMNADQSSPRQSELGYEGEFQGVYLNATNKLTQYNL